MFSYYPHLGCGEWVYDWVTAGGLGEIHIRFFCGLGIYVTGFVDRGIE